MKAAEYWLEKIWESLTGSGGASTTGIVLATGTNVIGGAKDAGPQWTVSRKYTASADATGTVAITDAPASGQKVFADDILISVDTAMSVSVQEETSNTVFAKVYMAANSTVQLTLRDGIKAAVADKKLYIDTSASGNIAVTCCWHSEA